MLTLYDILLTLFENSRGFGYISHLFNNSQSMVCRKTDIGVKDCVFSGKVLTKALLSDILNSVKNTERKFNFMKFVYKIEDLDCAHCAAKMEKAISKIDGVQNVSISFLAQKLTIEADESKIEEIIAEAKEICKKVEPDCKIITK